jgi:hypothetical protein
MIGALQLLANNEVIHMAMFALLTSIKMPK